MTDQELASLVRRADPDRFLGVLFAPPARRRDLLTLYAFNHELARAREVASSGPLALIRLHWWREVVEGADRAHPVATLLRAALARGAFAPADLAGLIDAREAEADGIPDRAAFMHYIRGTAGSLMRIASQRLGVTDPADLHTIEDIGTGTGIAFLLRAAPALHALGRDLLPQDGTSDAILIETARALLTARSPRAALPAQSPRAALPAQSPRAALPAQSPRAALPATLPAVLARRDLARLQTGLPSRPRGAADRFAVITAGLSGKHV